MGGQVPGDTDYLKEKFIDKPRQEHSLKGRAKEIKSKYNHKFKSVDIFMDVPDITALKFEKK
jgi:hypothetical protein